MGKKLIVMTIVTILLFIPIGVFCFFPHGTLKIIKCSVSSLCKVPLLVTLTHFTERHTDSQK